MRREREGRGPSRTCGPPIRMECLNCLSSHTAVWMNKDTVDTNTTATDTVLHRQVSDHSINASLYFMQYSVPTQTSERGGEGGGGGRPPRP